MSEGGNVAVAGLNGRLTVVWRRGTLSSNLIIEVVNLLWTAQICWLTWHISKGHAQAWQSQPTLPQQHPLHSPGWIPTTMHSYALLLRSCQSQNSETTMPGSRQAKSLSKRERQSSISNWKYIFLQLAQMKFGFVWVTIKKDTSGITTKNGTLIFEHSFHVLQVGYPSTQLSPSWLNHHASMHPLLVNVEPNHIYHLNSIPKRPLATTCICITWILASHPLSSRPCFYALHPHFTQVMLMHCLLNRFHKATCYSCLSLQSNIVTSRLYWWCIQSSLVPFIQSWSNKAQWLLHTWLGKLLNEIPMIQFPAT